MILHTISVVPIEFFTDKRTIAVENKLVAQRLLYACDEDVSKIFCEVGGIGARLYSFSPIVCRGAKLAFHESSGCIYFERQTSPWHPTRDRVLEELIRRNAHHRNIIANEVPGDLGALLAVLRSACPSDDFGEVSLNYVFSFYILEHPDGPSIDFLHLKILAEPSLVDLDDALSTEINGIYDISAEIKDCYLDELSDVDIANNASTYITWATIVSVTEPAWTVRTKSLLAALECRLQIVWNRCYSISQFVDKVFQDEEKPKSVQELYWSFSRTLDDAKAVLSSTYSSRADRLFSEMVLTSKVKGEIERLEQKVSLLEKYMDEKDRQQSRKYQKTIELLLFVTALASLAQLFFPLPLAFMPEFAAEVLIVSIAIIGGVAIWKTR
jgi:hypothetical protein